MKSNYLEKTEKLLKRYVKRKVSLNSGTVVAFLITGLFMFTNMNVQAGFNNSVITNGVLDNQNVPGNRNFIVTEPSRTTTATTGAAEDNIIMGRYVGTNISGDQNFIVGNGNAGEGLSGINNVVLGKSAGKQVSGHNNVALGEGAGQNVTGINNFAAGPYEAGTGVTGNYNIAIGNQSGQNVGNDGSRNIANKSDNNTTGMGRNNIAIGRLAGNSVEGNENIAIGGRVGEAVGSAAINNGMGIYNVAVGADSGNRVQGRGNVALGENAGNDVTGSNNLSFGVNAGNKVAGSNNIILGKDAGKDLNGTIANETVSIGTGTLANKNNVTAVGYKAKATEDNTLALGGNATANLANSVALGDNSATIEKETTATITQGTDNTYTKETIESTDKNTKLDLNFAGGDKVVGVVSVGNENATRRIQNVAPGLLSSTSTDAVNGSQLYALSKEVADIKTPSTYFHTNTGDANQGAGDLNTNLGKITDKAGATGTHSITAGVESKASDESAVAIGYKATAIDAGAIALGDRVNSNGGVAIGVESQSIGGVALGDNTQAEHASVALGNGSKAKLGAAIAIGYEAEASFLYSTAIGTQTKATKYHTVALGTLAQATGEHSTAIGHSAEAKGDDSIAIGYEAETIGKNSIALGNTANAHFENSIAIGTYSQAIVEDGVALGTYSTAKTAEGEIGYDMLTGKAHEFAENVANIDKAAWQSTRAAVSIGNLIDDEAYLVTRQITGVAAGTKDTDAVNVAQLKSLDAKVNENVQTYFHTNTGDADQGAGDPNTNLGKVGDAAGAIGYGSITAGIGAKAIARNSIAIGMDANSEGGVAIGTNVRAFNGVVIGENIDGAEGVAIGDGVSSSYASNVAIGFETKARGHHAIAMGLASQANGIFSTAIGPKTKAADNSVALGYASEADINGAVALGIGAKAREYGSTAIGGSEAKVSYGVALGSGSISEREAGTDTGKTGYDFSTGKDYVIPDGEENHAWQSNKGDVSIGAPNRYDDFITRQITGVAAGSEDTDAVNVAQLKSLDQKLEANVQTYFHTNTGDANQGAGDPNTNLGKITDKAGATGIHSITAGVNAKAKGEGSIAIGQDAETDGSGTVSIGYQAGKNSNGGDNNVFLGTSAGAGSKNASSNVAIGMGAGRNVNTSNNIAIGENAGVAASAGTIAIGNNTEASASFALAFGGEAKARGYESMALGNSALALSNDGTALGAYAISHGTDSVAIGRDSTSYAENSFAAVNGASSAGQSSVAIGKSSRSDSDSSLALGTNASVISTNATITMADGTSITPDEISSGKFRKAVKSIRNHNNSENSIALGNSAKVTDASNAVAIGASAEITSGSNSAVALGDGAQVTVENGIALGASSVAKTTEGEIGYDMLTGQAHVIDANATDAEKATWQATRAAVSVGDVENNITRQITGVAAGTQDTDAVNVAQLKSLDAKVNENVQTYFHTNTGDANQGAGDPNTNLGKITDKAGAIGNHSITAGLRAKAENYGGVAIGNNANADGTIGGVAIGLNAHTNRGISLGKDAYSEDESVALGNNSRATDIHTIAIGTAAIASTSTSTAIGWEAKAKAKRAVALGTSARVEENEGVAIGYRASVTMNGENSVALGADSAVNGKNSTALGYASSVHLDNSVALGYYSKVSEAGKTTRGIDNSYTSTTIKSKDGKNEFDLNFAGGDKTIGVVSVGREELGYQSSTRRIQNVAPGLLSEESTDAVNGSQLYALSKEVAEQSTTYFHTNTGDTNQGAGNPNTNLGKITDKAGATGIYSITAGIGAKAKGEESIAIGYDSESELSGVAIGASTNAGYNSAAIGNGAKATEPGAVALGATSESSGYYSSAIGYGSKASGVGAIGIGLSSDAVGDLSIAIGNTVRTYKDNSTSIGSQVINEGERSTAIGYGSYIDKNVEEAINIGHRNFIGAVDSQGNPLPENEKVTHSVAIGHDNIVNTSNTYILGGNISGGTVENSVYLGSRSTIKDVTDSNVGREIEMGTVKNLTKDFIDGNTTTGGARGKVSKAKVGNLELKDFAGATSYGAVTVGSSEEERRIQNVAAGEISKTSTDAINGSQLYATNNILGNLANTVATTVGGKTKITSDGSIIPDDIANTGKDNIHDAIIAARTEVKSKDNSITVTEKEENGRYTYDLSVDTGKIAKNTNLSYKANGQNSQTVTLADGLNFVNGTNTVATVGANGEVKYDLSQDTKNKIDNAMSSFNIKANNEATSETISNGNTVTFKQGDNIEVTRSGKEITIATSKNPKFDSVTVNNGGPVINKDGINMNNKKITNVAQGTEGTDAVNLNQLNAAKTEVVGGTNVASVTTSTGNKGQTIYTVNAEGAKVSAGSSYVTVKAGDKDKNNVTNYTVDLSQATKDKIDNIAGDISNKGLTFTGDSGTTGIKKLGDTVAITGDTNITTTATTEGVKVALNKNLDLTDTGSVKVGDTTINKDGLVIKDGPSITNKGIDAGSQKIINVADGKISKDSEEAINGSQLHKVADSIKNIFGGDAIVNPDGTILVTNIGGTGKNNVNDAIKAARTEVVDGKNTTVKSTIGSAGQTIYNVNVEGDLTGITSISNGDTKIALGKDKDGNKTVDVGGSRITNVADGKDAKDAVNVSQLVEAKNEINNNINNINQNIDKMDTEMKHGFANSAAMSTLKYMEIGTNQVTVGAAIGTYKGTQAVAVGVQGAPSENTRVHAQVSLSPSKKGTESMAGVGAAWRFNIK